jgi:hypothetical protein
MQRNLGAAALLCAICACSQDPATLLPADGGRDAGTDAGPDAGSDAGTGSCSGGTYGGGELSEPAGAVTATFLDTVGAPVAAQPAYICGIDLCSAPTFSGTQGQVALSPALSMKRRAFKFGDAINYASFALPLSGTSTVFGSLPLGRLPATGAALTPGTTATSGDVSVDVPVGAVVAIDTLTYSTAAQQTLRTAAIPVTTGAALLASAPASGFKLLYGLGPAETTICPPAKVTVALPHATSAPNDFGWAAGAAVEFWVASTDVGQRFSPYAGWAKMSDGVVSADGKSVSTLAGQGFAALEAFAVRLH